MASTRTQVGLSSRVQIMTFRGVSMNNNLFMGSQTDPLASCQYMLANLQSNHQINLAAARKPLGSRMHNGYSKDILPDEMQKHVV
jgi:hypothetical protein